MLSQLLHIHISLLPDKIFIKNKMKFALLFEKLQGSKTKFRPQLDSPSTRVLFPFILFGQSSFLHCTAPEYLKHQTQGGNLTLLCHIPGYHYAQDAWKHWLSKPPFPIPVSFEKEA